jgi:hypothetical protein
VFDDLDEGGGRSWIFGLVAVVALAAALWYWFDLSDRLGATDENPDPTATLSALSTAAPTRTATVASTATNSSTETTAPNPVTVPDVIRASRTDAENALTSRGFNVKIGDPVYSDSVPEGAVAEQHPVAGTSSNEGATITLSLSAGLEPVDLAAIRAIGRPRDDVVDELTSVGLNVTLVDEGSESVPEGAVIRLEPDDEALAGDSITIFVSHGDQVQIPARLQGEPLAKVRAELESLGLEVADQIAVPASTLRDNGIEPDEVGINDGDVVGIQDNGAQFGGWVDRGSSVTIIYYDEDKAEPTIGPSN